MFYLHFLITSLISSTVVLVILVGKKLMNNQISARWQIRIWYLMLISSTLPFVLLPLWNGKFAFWADAGLSSLTQNTNMPITNNGTSTALLRDFAVSVNRPDFYTLNVVVGVIWISGILVLAFIAVMARYRLKQISKNAEYIHDTDIITLFQQCQQRLCVNRHFSLMKSADIRSPITFGLIRIYMILPANISKKLSKKEMEHIFLHEISHIKYRDNQINILICLLRLIYWFNPLIWIGIKEMKLDREIACDMSVLNLMDEYGRLEYGYTILNFVDRNSHHFPLTTENGIGGTGRQIKKRLEKILSFNQESPKIKTKGIITFLIIAIMVACQLPLMSVFAVGPDHYFFSERNASYEDLSSYFSGYNGCIVLYDMQADHYEIYNKEKSTLRVSPDSTFKIYSALKGLDQHVITENSTMEWNHSIYPYDSWNMDQTLSSGLKNSVNWYFQNIDRSVGLNILGDFYKRLGYGNCNLSGGINNYWMESSLLISPIEQVQILQKFYSNSFGFRAEDVNAIKNALRISEKGDAVLSGKTGSGVVNGMAINGWFIGYVEKNGNVYFFATNIQGQDNATGEKAAELTLSILEAKQIY